jgi:hypothetical protein
MKHLLLFHQHRGMMMDGDLNTQNVNNTSNTSRFLHSLGYRYWAASLLPAVRNLYTYTILVHHTICIIMIMSFLA